MKIKLRLSKLEQHYAIYSDTCHFCGRPKGEMPLAFLPYEGDVPGGTPQAACTMCAAYPECYFYDVNDRATLEVELRQRLGVTPADEVWFREEYRFLFFDEIAREEAVKRQQMLAESNSAFICAVFPIVADEIMTPIVGGSIQHDAIEEWT